MDARGTGLMLVAVGLGIAALGLLVWSGALSFFGRLPGDFRYEGENTRVYFPVASCVVVSIVISAVAGVIRRFL